jgi:hypothetical protein
MSRLRDVSKVLVSRGVVSRTTDFLREVGRSGCEGIVLWVGTIDDTTAQVADAFIPRQRAFRAGGGVCVVADDASLASLNQQLYDLNLRLLVQVHSHPGGAFHSEADDENSIITTIGGLSLVVPDFAVNPFTLENVAVLRRVPDGWVPLSVAEATALIELEN